QEGADDRPDQPGWAQLEPVTGKQTDRETTDEGTEQPGDDRGGPVDVGHRAAEDELGDAPGDNPEAKEGDDEHDRHGSAGRRAAPHRRSARPGNSPSGDEMGCSWATARRPCSY